ncbi:MAG: oligopeptide transporter, OPT family [Planctomycetes bacterium]|nr:oligopeptide transporter, OPT family [Planctomycetota bacterium]
MQEDKAPPNLAEFTFKAVAVGVLLGLVFGAANAYLGLRVGMTVSASIPAAVMTVALFQLFRARGTILEANLSQTIGSASTSLATGTIFTIPALYMWGVAPPYWQMVVLAFLGGVLGLAAMIPLRRLLIVREHATLPYPEGTACAEVLKATSGGASGAQWIFLGMAVGALVQVAIKAAFLVPPEVGVDLLPAYLPKAHVAIEIAPALIGVGFILGFRQAGVCVAGGIIAALVLVPALAKVGEGLLLPLAPETKLLIKDMSAEQIRKAYVRYIGAGAVAAAGILTVLRSLPAMTDAFLGVLRGIRGRGDSAGADVRTDRDLPGWFTLVAVAVVVAVAAFVPGVLAGDMPLSQRLVCAGGIGVLGVLFVTVAARIVGIVGVSSQPTSGIALLTLIVIASVFAANGWTGPGAAAAVLTAGTIVTVAASKAGDISQDLKTGWLVGATPARQQFGQLIGAAFACWAVAATVVLLGQNYVFGEDLGAPQATLMKTIIEGVLTGNLPWEFVLSGAGLSIGAMLCGVSGLAFAIGVYLPLATMAPLFVGGCARLLYEKASGRSGEVKKGEGMDAGVLAASGLVAGEALTGVVIAGLVGAGVLDKEKAAWLTGATGAQAGVALVLLVCFFLYSSRTKPAR